MLHCEMDVRRQVNPLEIASEAAMGVVVFGSINMDLVARTVRLPAPGETVAGLSFVTTPGGKGANQAVACARLGAQTTMVGRVGGDSLGVELQAALETAGVDVEYVHAVPGPSGVAQIVVDEAGQNMIVVVPGANGTLGPDDTHCLEKLLANAGALLLQLEIPLKASWSAAEIAFRHGVPAIFDPAPAPSVGLASELYRVIGIITPNETEAAALVGFPIDDDASARRAATILRERGCNAVIIKRGARGALLADADGMRHLDPFPVNVVDTVAAGDAFNGALAVGLSEGMALDAAARFAMAAGALAVTKPGAQAAMPTRAELEALLQQKP